MKTFHERLYAMLDEYAHDVYRVTKSFPREELYGVTSQLRRASLSVILNYIEGYARKKKLVYVNFLETAYGSLQESKYLLEFSREEGFLVEGDYKVLSALAGEMGAMLWKTIEG